MEKIKLSKTKHIKGKMIRRVKEDYKYKDFTVKKKFITNGASVPKFLQSIHDPFDSEYLTPCVIHDYLYYTHIKDRKASDIIFKEACLEYGTDIFITYLFYYLVRIFGWHYYNKNTKDKRKRRF